MRRVRRLLNNPRSVEVVSKAPNFATKRRYNRVQAAGIHYERLVITHFQNEFGDDRVVPGPWIRFTDDKGNSWCQPDLFILPPHRKKTLWVGECKLKASKAAEERLTNMYTPLAALLYPDHKIIGVQFCRHLASLKNMENQNNLIEYEELLDMKKYDKDFYTVNLRRVY